MQLDDKYVEEFKEIHRKEYGTELSDEEARDAAHRLIGLAELAFDCAMKDSQRKKRLEKEPDGFPVDGQYSCLVCGDSINESNGWYSWFGQTCLTCKKAIKEGVIPVFVCKQHDSYFKMWELNSDFKIKSVTARKYIKEGKLKAREILTENGKVHCYLFLKKENPGLIKQHSPERKSYDRNRAKVSRMRNKEKLKEWKEEFRQKRVRR